MDAYDAAGMTGIIWRRVNPALENEAEAVMRDLMALSHKSPGFLGSEIFPPIPGVQDAYVVIYRFSKEENLRGWLNSATRAELVGRLEGLLLQPAFEFFVAHRGRAPGTASTVFSYRIHEGCEADFHDWRRRISEVCRHWEGFLGAEAFDTRDSVRAEFVVVVRFDSKPHLDAWLQSPIRADFMREVRPFVEDYQVRRTGTGFEGWFDISEDKSPPATWRQGMVILAALFPVIMILRDVLSPMFTLLPFPLAFLILLTIDVALLTYGIMPHFSRWMAFWLRPKPGTWRSEALGWAVLLTLLGVTLGVTLLRGD